MSSRLAQYSQQAANGHGYEEKQPIPKGTEVVMFIEEAAWDRYINRNVTPPVDDEFIKLRLKTIDGDEYEGRTIFHKLQILGRADQNAEKNEKTVDNAYLFLAAYDNICLGGALARLKNDPEDTDLAKLVGKRVLVTVGINSYKNNFEETVRNNTVRMVAALPARDGGRSSRDADSDSGAETRSERPRRRSR